MEFELEHIADEAPVPRRPEPADEPLQADFDPEKPVVVRQRHESSGPASEHQQRLAAYRVEQDLATIARQRAHVARIRCWTGRALTYWRCLILGVPIGFAIDHVATRPLSVAMVIVPAIGAWWLASRWFIWAMAPGLAGCAELPPRPPPMPQDGLQTPEELIAERRWQLGLQTINDALVEFTSRWRAAEVMVAMTFGGILMILPTWGLLNRSEMLLGLQGMTLGWCMPFVTVAIGVIAMTAMGWLAVVRTWGVIRCLLALAVAAPLVGYLPVLLYSSIVHANYTFFQHVLFAVPVGMLLGLWIEHLDRAAAQRTG